MSRKIRRARAEGPCGGISTQVLFLRLASPRTPLPYHQEGSVMAIGRLVATAAPKASPYPSNVASRSHRDATFQLP